MLERTFDPIEINALANDPDVRPYIGGDGPLDLTGVVERPEHLFLVGEHGGFGLLWSAPSVMEVHTFITRDGRGPWAYEAARDMIAQASDAGVWMLWTRIRSDMRNVIAFARRFGMTPTGETIETLGHPYKVYKMEVATCH
jgi:hypothetical protein